MYISERPRGRMSELAHHRDGGRAAPPQRRLRADGETDPESTSYALAGADVRRQRKYRNWSIFKKSRRPLVFLLPPRHPTCPPGRDRCRSGTWTLHPAGGWTCGRCTTPFWPSWAGRTPIAMAGGQGATAGRQIIRRAPRQDCAVAEGGDEPSVTAGVKGESPRATPM